MINLLRAEWIKLHTVAMNLVLGIIAVVFPLLVTLITAGVNGDKTTFDTRNLIDLLVGSSFVTVLLAGVIAAAAITSEFGFGTIRPAFAATPRRTRVLIAKGIMVVFAAIVIEAVVVVVGLVAGTSLATSQGATIDLGTVPTAVPALVGVVVLAGLAALVGYGLGMLVRSTPVAVVVFILWPLLAEALVGALLAVITGSDTVINWLPFQSGFRMALVNVDEIGPTRLVSGFYFGGVGAVLAVFGAWMVNRRDA